VVPKRFVAILLLALLIASTIKKALGGSDFISDIFIGLFNVVQGAHRNISPETYNLCAKQDIATCIEPDGHIKKSVR
jgi:hypothetical protein